jgi:hypothetical protein
MARLTDPAVLARYKQALGDWKVAGAILPKGQRVLDEFRTTLEDVDWKSFTEALHRFVVEEDGEIDQVKEDREGWREHWEYHYDLRPTIHGVKLYVETLLHPESFSSRDDPVIYIVRIKPA